MQQSNLHTLTCAQAKLLMVPMQKDDQHWATSAQRQLFQMHINHCPACRGEYDQISGTLDLVQSFFQMNDDVDPVTESDMGPAEKITLKPTFDQTSVPSAKIAG